jgi:hypothetical protein
MITQILIIKPSSNGRGPLSYEVNSNFGSAINLVVANLQQLLLQIVCSLFIAGDARQKTARIKKRQIRTFFITFYF